MRDSNSRPSAYKADALPAELIWHNGGIDGTWTRDLLRDRQAF